jgi:hypothetical protein
MHSIKALRKFAPLTNQRAAYREIFVRRAVERGAEERAAMRADERPRQYLVMTLNS